MCPEGGPRSVESGNQGEEGTETQAARLAGEKAETIVWTDLGCSFMWEGEELE